MFWLLLHFSVMMSIFIYTTSVSYELKSNVSDSRLVPASSRPLTHQELKNLVAFTKLFGYVRYFHPSDGAAALDWNKFAIYGVNEVCRAKDREDLIVELRRLFSPFAPTVRIFDPKQSSFFPGRPQYDEDGTRLIAWLHQGPDFSNPYHYLSDRVDKSKFPPHMTFPSPNKPFIAELIPGIECSVPLTLYADSIGSLPHAKDSATLHFGNGPIHSVSDRATRLSDVVVAWNIIQHFYPYFDAIRANWDQVLRQSLDSAAKDSSALLHRSTMKWMQVQLNDGHGIASEYRGTNGDSTLNIWWLPFKVDWIENKLVITKISSDTLLSVHLSDIILKVDGVPAGQYLAEQERYIPGATEQMKRWWSTWYLPQVLGDRIDLQVQTAPHASNTISFTRPNRKTTHSSDSTPPRLKPRELKKGVFYLDLEWFRYDDFESVAEQLSRAKGIIFDVRAYPNAIGEHFLSHLIDSTIVAPPYFAPLVTRPNRKDMSFVQVEQRTIQPEAPHIHAKICFLTGPRAMSFAEHLLSMVHQYKIGLIIGESTAGTNGNINWLTLPSGYDFVWTALRARNYDGSQFLGVGIHPDIQVHRSIRAVKEQRDEVLEKALEVLDQ